MRRALQTLEQVHAQHGGEVVLPRALIEAEFLAFGFQFGLVHQVRGRRVHGQAQLADALVQVVVGELALAVRWRVQIDGPLARREAADVFNHLRVVAADVFPGAGDGHRVEEREEVRAQAGEQRLLAGIGAAGPIAPLGFPLQKLLLRRAEHCLDAADAKGVLEGVLPLLRHQVDLVAQIAQAGVHRRGGEHQHLAVDAAFEHFREQAVVAAATDHGAVFVDAVAAFVAEVVGFVDHDEIESAPVELRQVDVGGPTFVAAQVRVRQHRVAQAVLVEGIVAVRGAGRVAQPVLFKSFRAEHQHAFVAQLEEFDDRQRRPRLAEAHAVRHDAAVVAQQAVDGVGGAVALELVERLPHCRLVEIDILHQAIALAVFRQPFLEDVEERLVVDELRRVGRTQSRQRGQHFLLRIAGEIVVRPQRVEPLAQGVALLGAADQRVQFDVGNAPKAKPAPREVGTAEQRRAGAVRAGDVIELAVQEVGLIHGANVHLALDPRRARLCEGLLRERLLEGDAAVVGQPERLGLAGGGIDRADPLRIAVEKTQRTGSLQNVAQCLEGVDGEVGGDERHGGPRRDLAPKHVADPTVLVVDDAA